MLRAYRFPMKPTPYQEGVLEHLLYLCRTLYNAALEDRILHYKKSCGTRTKYEQQVALTQIRAEDPEYGSVSACVLRSSLDKLDKSYKAFFRRVKSGDHARKLAKELITKYDAVAFEDLQIRNMVRNPSLAKSINDAGWGLFLSCLTYKAEEAGKWALGVDPRGTSQRCSQCYFVCPNCGFCASRDHNAALNIQALGWSAVSSLLGKPDMVAEACESV